MKNFAITGVAGYVAPRHLRAIKETGNRVVAALDPHDAVGVLDTYFDDLSYFREFERFDRHVDKLRKKGDEERIHYVSICAPNYLHDAHIRLALRIGADAICEKPLVLNPWNLEALRELEGETARKIYTILQLRHHPSIQALKERFSTSTGAKKEIVLTYIAPRGDWYLHSWKGDKDKSGGLSTNIGIHFFDMLIWVFGRLLELEVHVATPKKESGFLELERARVRWFLSIDKADLPKTSDPGIRRTHRSINVDGEEIEFSDGFGDLHTVSYQHILDGRGFTVEDARASIEAAYEIRNAFPMLVHAHTHPLAGR